MSGQPARAPATLTSLPAELLLQISSHLTTFDAVSFAGVSRHTAPYAEASLWRDLNLYLKEDLQGGEDENATVREDLADAQLEGQVEEKIRRIFSQGNPRRWGMVERVKTVRWPGAIGGQLEILEAVSPNLKSLTIDAPVHRRYTGKRVDLTSLDRPFTEFSSVLPLLTHVTFGPSAIQNVDTLTRLCALAPNLHTVSAELAHRAQLSLVGDRSHLRPEEASLRQLRLSLGYGGDAASFDATQSAASTLRC